MKNSVDSLVLVEKVPGEETYHFLHSKNFSGGIKKVVVRKKTTGELVIGSLPGKTSITDMVGVNFTITDLSSVIQTPQ